MKQGGLILGCLNLLLLINLFLHIHRSSVDARVQTDVLHLSAEHASARETDEAVKTCTRFRDLAVDADLKARIGRFEDALKVEQRWFEADEKAFSSGESQALADKTAQRQDIRATPEHLSSAHYQHEMELMERAHFRQQLIDARQAVAEWKSPW